MSGVVLRSDGSGGGGINPSLEMLQLREAVVRCSVKNLTQRDGFDASIRWYSGRFRSRPSCTIAFGQRRSESWDQGPRRSIGQRLDDSESTKGKHALGLAVLDLGLDLDHKWCLAQIEAREFSQYQMLLLNDPEMSVDQRSCTVEGALMQSSFVVPRAKRLC